MTVAAIILAVLLMVWFLFFGISKVLAVPAMRERAEQTGYSVAAYRRIGVCDIAAAISLPVGIAWWPLGAAAGTGLLLLMAGAGVVHRRTGDGIAGAIPAIVTGIAVIGYLATLFTTI